MASDQAGTGEHAVSTGPDTGTVPPADVAAPRARTPLTSQSGADAAALGAALALPLLGAFLKLLSPGWMVLLAVMLSPVLIGVYAAGVVVFTRTFRTRSPIRALWGAVPRRYHVVAWAWGVVLFVPPVVMPDLDDRSDYSVVTRLLGYTHPPDWYWNAYPPVLSVFAVAAVVLTIAAWWMFRTDLRRVEPQDHLAPAEVGAHPAGRSTALTGLNVVAGTNGVLMGCAAVSALASYAWFDLVLWLPASVWALVFGWRVLRRAISDPPCSSSEVGALPHRCVVLLGVWGVTVPLPALLALLIWFDAPLGLLGWGSLTLLGGLLPSVVATVVLWRVHQADVRDA